MSNRYLEELEKMTPEAEAQQLSVQIDRAWVALSEAIALAMRAGLTVQHWRPDCPPTIINFKPGTEQRLADLEKLEDHFERLIRSERDWVAGLIKSDEERMDRIQAVLTSIGQRLNALETPPKQITAKTIPPKQITTKTKRRHK